MKNTIKKTTVFILSAFLSLSVLAQPQIEGVDIEQTLTDDGDDLQLLGAGVRTKFFFDIYVASLYTSGAFDPAVLQPSPKVRPAPNVELPDENNFHMAVRLNIVTSLISASRMANAVRAGFERSAQDNLEPLQARLDQFIQVFSGEEISKGDQFTLFGSLDEGVQAYKNGQLVITVEGSDFYRALFGVWLGEDPVSASLKHEMLNHSPE